MSDVRLRALRMVGFKSFAEKTVVEFGPGISAIVGPNGAGKSNLADALRWALGEQGRSLRTRRAEDVIFAGSSSRRAIGMADVALVIDNSDRLLPVDFAEVELGRRLFRSGENEYLLNRQRIRLRDLAGLLDAANLADNAFLFIGQGMVDQALALRPEERRPLFEEAAGIRRHDRRRRRAEVELAEAEVNLERVRDLLAELRPQARRLAAQAEQQEARRTAGTDLAAALVAMARDRLTSAMRIAESHHTTLAAAQRDADTALADLRVAEEAAARISRALADRADEERTARGTLDTARAATVELRMTETRLAAESSSLQRESERLTAERAATEKRADEARRSAAAPIPDEDPAATEAMRDLDAAVIAAGERLAELRDRNLALDERLEAARRDEAARGTELERLRRADETARAALAAMEPQATAAAGNASASDTALAEAAKVAQQATERDAAAEADFETARAGLEAAESNAQRANAEHTGLTTRLDALRASLAAVDAALATGSDERLVRSARARGGQRVAEGLEVDAGLRLAVEAVLGEAIAGMLVDAASVPALAEAGSGTLVVRDAGTRARTADAARAEAAVTAAGGGRLIDAVRRDPGGAVSALLARALWVPDLAAALDVRASLPPGWRVATRDGALISDEGVIRLGGRASRLDREADRAELQRSLEPLEAQIATAAADVAAGERTRTAARDRVAAGRRDLDEARRARRVAEDAERAVARRAESAAREHAWTTAQLERARSTAAIAADAFAAHAEASRAQSDERSPTANTANTARTVGAKAAEPEIASIEERLVGLRARRERLAATVAEGTRARRDAEDRRRRAEVALAMDEAQLVRLDAEVGRIVGLVADAAVARDRLVAEHATAAAHEQRLSTALDAILGHGSEDRQGLLVAERTGMEARERLRGAEGRSRAAEVGEMEARLQVDSVREQLLVELAGIGEAGLEALEAEASEATPLRFAPTDDLAEALERGLQSAVSAWHAAAPEPGATGPGRLAALRRRYHELGASNPFAATEYAEVKARVETLDAQRDDLTAAIRSTRELIAELNALITTQFRSTFTALEDAFSRRFRQLFDGGEAQLSLTDPDDLSTTGVEITARPPGKKRQPLAMLSGGERALTAVALLMSILEVRPVPFCVLDEVDAALDEANIGRFSAALRTLAEKIQFVVITHNRGTIEAADALYGVTVGDDAVSHVISLRLGEVAIDERRVVAIPVA